MLRGGVSPGDVFVVGVDDGGNAVSERPVRIAEG
jgi:hypothetical protein